MKNRMGEKVGWTAGWIGGFIWIFILSLVFLFQRKLEQGLLGIVLTALAIFTIIFFAPWRFSSTPYWKLMLAPYGMFFLSIIWALWSYGGFENLSVTWNILWFFPFFLIPFGNLSNKRWAEHTELQSKDIDSKDISQP